MRTNSAGRLVAAALTLLTTFLAGLGVAVACRPGPGYLDKLYPAMERADGIPAETAFTVGYHGTVDASDQPGLPVSATLTGPSGEELELAGEPVASQGLVGGYIRLEPDEPLPEGKVELQVSLKAAGSSSRPTEMSRTYTVDPDRGNAEPSGFGGVEASTVQLESAPNSCSSETFSRVRASLQEETVRPAYAVVTFTADGGDAEQSFAISGDQFSGKSIDLTFDTAYKAECVGVKTVSPYGARSNIADSCSVRDCGSQQPVASWRTGQWSSVCGTDDGDVGPEPDPDQADVGPLPSPDDVGPGPGDDTGPAESETGTTGPDAGAAQTDGGLDWQERGSAGGCSNGGSGPLPLGSMAWLLLGLGALGRRLDSRR